MAYHMNCLLADTGPIKHVQCDNGTEFVAEVLQALADFSCGPDAEQLVVSPADQRAGGARQRHAEERAETTGSSRRTQRTGTRRSPASATSSTATSRAPPATRRTSWCTARSRRTGPDSTSPWPLEHARLARVLNARAQRR